MPTEDFAGVAADMHLDASEKLTLEYLNKQHKSFVQGKLSLYWFEGNFYSDRKKKFGKKQLAKITDKRKKKYERVKKLSYKNYFSSNKEIKQAHKDGIYVDRLILKICFSKAELTYYETKYQFQNEVLENDKYLNGNILGRFYKGKIWIKKF